jgi:hypothetical protein
MSLSPIFNDSLDGNRRAPAVSVCAKNFYPYIIFRKLTEFFILVFIVNVALHLNSSADLWGLEAA